MEPALGLSSQLSWLPPRLLLASHLSCRMATMGPVTRQCTRQLSLLHGTVASLHGDLWGCQQSLCLCRLTLFLPHSEIQLREELPPTTSFFLVEVSLFTFPVDFNTHFSFFSGPGDPFPLSSLPHIVIVHCLDRYLREALSLRHHLPGTPAS